MKYALLVTWAFLTLVATSTHAQVVTIDADNLDDEPRVLTKETWGFQAGDSLGWANPDYDDAHWDTTGSLLLLNDSLYLADWAGMGWFRLKFQVTDTTARHLLLNASGYGVAELFLDGQRVFSTGHIPGGEPGAVAEAVEPEEIDESVIFTVRSDSVHTLAVRYANPLLSPWVGHVLRYTSKELTEEYVASGLRVEMVAPGAQKSVTKSGRSLSMLLGLTAGVIGALAALGMLIYLLGVRDKALLYLTLALVLLALSLGSSLYFNLTPGIAWKLPVFTPLLFMSFKVTVLFLGLGMSVAFFPGRRLLQTTLLVMVVLVLVSDFSAAFSPLNRMLILGMNTVFYGVLGAIAITAIWQKKPGSWTLGVGLLLCFSIIVVVVLSGSDEIYWQIIAILLIPVSIGGLIVRRYAESTKAKLAAEQDRQRLIETQKERLEVEVTARTHELRQSMQRLNETQEQLIQSEKLASLGSLTAGIAHEIKNPLNFVNNFAEVGGELADELSEAIAAGRTEEATAVLAELKSNAAQITKHGRRADDIVKAMMQHARGGTAERDTVDVNVFLEEYANLAWHGMRAKDHDFQAELDRSFDPDAGSLTVVPQDLGRVILNLLNNAFDAVRDTENARVTIASKRTADGIAISVSDNGPGIPEAIRQKIFEPFFTTKPTGEGTGLGLSLSHDIVTKGHGGTMTVSNSEQGGARFDITIPTV